MRILTDNRCEDIKQEVSFMFEECEISSYPIDCFDIANKLYYVLKPYSSLTPEEYMNALCINPDGFSRVETNPTTGMNQYVIYYNDYAQYERMRWTIFHEIGHIYLGHHDNPDDSNSATEEAEANFFAKYAIAPPPLIAITHCSDASDIANIFCVSAEASEYSYEYYMKWMKYGPRCYASYERRMLRLFLAA